MATLERLIIRRFRHVAPDTDLTFSPGFNVVLGQNGTGKTTLLRLISVVLRMDLSHIMEEPFDLEWHTNFTTGHRLHVVVKNLKIEREAADSTADPQDLSQSATAPTPGPSFSLSYHLKVRDRDGKTVLEVQWGDAQSITMNGKLVTNARPAPPPYLVRAMYPPPVAPPARARAGRNGLIEPYFEAMSLRSAQRFDEGLDVYRNITSPLAEAQRRPERPFVRVSHGLDRRFGVASEFIPPAVVDAIFTRHFRPPGLNALPEGDLVFQRSEVPCLDRACQLLRFADCQLTLSLIKRERADEIEATTYGSPKFRFTKDDQSIIPDDYLSYGQKRLLAFLFYLDALHHVAIVDELVNGFHYEWIEKSLEYCQGRQVFLTSQNPLMLDSLTFEGEDSVRRTFVICRSRKTPGELERAEWKNIDAPSAAAFHAALQAGFLGISEVLRSLGLW